MADTNQLNSKLLVRELQGDPKLHIESCPGKTDDCIERLSISLADVLLWVANTPCGPTKTIDTIPELLRRFPKLRIILIIEALDKDQIVNAFRAGVRGLFSVEHGSIKGLIKCIHSVYEGQVWANNAQTLCLIDAARMSRYVRCLSCYLTVAAAPRSNPDCLRAAERVHHCIGSSSQGYSSIIQHSGDQVQVLAVLYKMVR